MGLIRDDVDDKKDDDVGDVDDDENDEFNLDVNVVLFDWSVFA